MEKLQQQEKAMFFAQYWQQEVFNYNKKSLYGVWCVDRSMDISEAYLSLTTLSHISDEDWISLAKIMETIFDLKYEQDQNLNYCKNILDTFKGKYERLPACIYQHIIQSGYAVDYYSAALGRVIKVEEQIALGWVKLR